MKAAGRCLKYIVVFVITLFSLTGLLAAAARIPRSAIRENVLASAEYLCEDRVFPVLSENVSGSKIDRYADSILLGIAWQYDAEHPLSSVMRSAYYYTPYQNENENLLNAVTEGYEANQQYLRYWHGSNVIVRPLLVFLELKEIYVLNGVLLAVLALLLIAMLFKRGDRAAAAGIALGLLMTGVWFVPLSLEYTWTFLLMLLFSVIGLRLTERGKLTGSFFMIAGMVTSYFDFLTTETLTLLVPLLLILSAEKKDGRAFPKQFCRAGKAAGFWGAGYAGMWISKWLLASVVLGENVMPYVSEHIGERLGGGIGVDLWTYLTGAVGKNISCLFPFDYGVGGWLAGFAGLLFIAYVAYVYHKKQIAWDAVLLYALIGLVPYVRYLVLHNHSYLHFFFTYRAQLATVLAVVLILGEITERRWLPHADARRRKP